MNELADVAKVTPSSEVRHWALAQVPGTTSTVTEPLGVIASRPVSPLHRSTGT